MQGAQDITLLTCQFNTLQLQQLRHLLAGHQLVCNLINCTIDQATWLPPFTKPDLILTEPILWELCSKEEILSQLLKAEVPIVIWSENITSGIMAIVFGHPLISCVRRTEDELPLIQFLSRNINLH